MLRSGIALAFVLTLALSAQAAEPAATTRPARFKALYLTHSAGFNHPVLGLSEKILTEIGAKAGIDVVTHAGYKQKKEEIDLKFLTPEYMQQFDAIILYTTGELPLTDVQKKALVDFVKEGKALVGIHAATDTFYEWPEFKELMGAQFKTHSVNDNVVTIKIEDKKHPATRMLGDEWKIADEIYQTREPVDRQKFHVLMSIDTDKTDLAKQKMEKGKVYDMAWCREYGKGRVFYTALGHREDVWENPKFQQHLIGGIKWAMKAGRAEGKAAGGAKKAGGGKKAAAEKKE